MAPIPNEAEVVRMLNTYPDNVLTKNDLTDIFRDAWPRIVEVVWDHAKRFGPVSFVCFGFDDPNWMEEEGRQDSPALEFVAEEVDGWHIVREKDGPVRIFTTHQSAGPLVVRFGA